MSLNVLIFILLFGALQGLLLLAVLLARKKTEPFHIFLSAYLAVMLMQVIFKTLSKGWLYHNIQQGYILSYYLPFLYGPLIFLYTKYYLQKTAWRWAQLLHFLPFTLYLVFYFVSTNDDNPPPIFIETLRVVPRMVLQWCSLGIYHVLAWRLITQASATAGGNIILNARLRLLQRFTVISFLSTACIAAALSFLYVNFPHYQDVRWSFILLTGFIYWISYENLKRPELFKVIQGNNKPLETSHIIPPLKVHYPPVKYSNSGLKEEEALRILKLLQTCMDTDKIYLDAELTIDSLAEKLCCQKHHLSQVLNEKLKRSFAELLNEKRTEEAKRILADPRFCHYKVSAIAYDAGFNSLSSFNDIFKKREGITPSRFRIISQRAQQSQIKRV
jgi:AraC-like DNA-binding protein